MGQLHPRPGAEHHRWPVHGDDDLSEPSIGAIGEGDLADLLPLVRAYCAFYETRPGDDALLALSRALIADPEHEGVQLLARSPQGAPIGFATLYWTWSSVEARRIGLMNDLYVDPAGRGGGVGTALIAACAERCRARGLTLLEWQTAPDNERAMRVYDATGAMRSTWHTYDLEL